MPRMSEAEKRKSHKRILEKAGEIFRQRGVETTSVSDVMQAAGLTHGGFYRHFKSKDELVAAAFKTAVDDVLNGMEAADSEEQKAAARRDYIATYLSLCHVGSRKDGCPLAALAGDLNRGAPDARREGHDALRRTATQLTPGDDPAQGVATLALMLGTVTLARLADEDSNAQALLDAGQRGVELIQNDWPE
ncbi:MAG: TetR/AcrR family transcriptional regulator [Roseibium sp.]|uniref:TetR/AcrR family transcriptional regulator n=1 Tax=Roseibium sp. TaxID=1936156 RepID=UPI003D9C459E